MNTYTSPEATEIGVADEVILGVKPGVFWDAGHENFSMSQPSVVDVDQ